MSVFGKAVRRADGVDYRTEDLVEIYYERGEFFKIKSVVSGEIDGFEYNIFTNGKYPSMNIRTRKTAKTSQLKDSDGVERYCLNIYEPKDEISIFYIRYDTEFDYSEYNTNGKLHTHKSLVNDAIEYIKQLNECTE